MNLQTEPLHLKEATVTCIPRLRGGVSRRSRSRGGGTGQVSVLDQVRDVVLRLAMLSTATSSVTKQQGNTTLQRTATRTTPSTRSEARVSPASSAYADSYRSEAIDDCIQFLKRSAAGGATAAAVEAVASPLQAPPAACATPCEL